MFYHVYCAGYTKHFVTLGQVQAWVDSKRASLAGETLKVWRVVDCLAEHDPIIHGPISA